MRYGSGSLSTGVLEAMDFTAEAGEFVVVLGRSGSGKSTLLNLLGGMDQPLAGTLRIGDDELTAMDEEARARFRRRAIGFVFQAFNLLPTLTVAENLALPLALNQRRERDLVPAMLERLGLQDRAARYPDQLSGGEQQRVAIGRALIHSPPLVLADEPTGNLDAATAASTLQAMLELKQEEGTALVLVTHDLAIAASMDRVVRLVDGRLEAA